ncbi:hypothetical protein [Collinsella stercoris]|uniref:Uncharacterized protein n=1 Tax=Collinsella stercoris DSM 13279 TaxID=445975 RepID=B6GDJ2_9ACTN|nr:hypothetical protein [Collinsella stercoris]EEA89631.1 hypothetical protein COLSTE_02173 [Collinsella stercoris DSM 13279]UEA45189.1 hypothetical protein LK434_08655 [Collinsella stercoris DSM 13279]UWP12286.1 hypothetical protein NQ498_03375 [Collinsella stercoris]
MLIAIFYLCGGLLSLLALFGPDAEKDMTLLVLAQLMFLSAGVSEIKGILRERINEH